MRKVATLFAPYFLIAKSSSKIACRLAHEIERCRANMYVLAHIAHGDAQTAGGDIPWAYLDGDDDRRFSSNRRYPIQSAARLKTVETQGGGA